MHCGGGLTMPGPDSRFLYFPSRSAPSAPFFYPAGATQVGSGQFKRGASLNERSLDVKDDEASFYELLGIPESGTLLEIKQAYKQLARKYHPDVSPPDRLEENTERFIRLQEAYETLSDPRSRALYDRDLAGGIKFAFSARRRYRCDEEMPEKSQWKNRWQEQLSELKRRSVNKEARGNMSWAARMRRQREEMSKGA